MARILEAAAALRGLCSSSRRGWASSFSPARALECDALLAACLAFVASSFSPAPALACEALSAACRAFVASSFSPALTFAREIALPAWLCCLHSLASSGHSVFSCRDGSASPLVSFIKEAARRSFLFLASTALKSSSAPFPPNISWHATKTMLLMDAPIRAEPNGLKFCENFAEKKEVVVLWFQTVARRCFSKRQSGQQRSR